jgi:hypothetical protein
MEGAIKAKEKKDKSLMSPEVVKGIEEDINLKMDEVKLMKRKSNSLDRQIEGLIFTN